MGLAGAHLIVLLVVFLVVVAAVAGLVYFVIRKSVAAGVRDGRRTTPEREQ